MNLPIDCSSFLGFSEPFWSIWELALITLGLPYKPSDRFYAHKKDDKSKYQSAPGAAFSLILSLKVKPPSDQK